MLKIRSASCFLSLMLFGVGCGSDNARESFTMAKASTVTTQEALVANQDTCSSQLTCYDLQVPLNHQKPQGKAIKVKFAVHKALKKTKGTLLLVFGGPGLSGISGLEGWLPTFDQTLLNEFDLVTFDLRGAHRSGGLDCPQAYNSYLFTPARGKTSNDREALAAAAKDFAKACPREMGLSLADLRLYNSEQAAQDLELFRQKMGYKSWTIHAMSYGTQLAQEYAARFPKQVKALALDGAVDLTFGLLQWEKDLAEAQNAVLVRSFRECSDDPACKKLFPIVKPSEAYRKIRQQLLRDEQIFADDKSLTLFDFEYTAGQSMASPAGRSAFLKGLAAAAEGDFVPLAKLAYGEASGDGRGSKTEPQEETNYSAMSNGVYFTFICNDYRLSKKNLDDQIAGFFANAEAYEKSGMRIRNALYSEIACAAWSNQAKTETVRPPFHAEEIPVLVVNSQADANVPAKYGYSVAKAAINSALIDVDGGKHIMYGYSNECIDAPVTNFLRTGILPEDRQIRCQDKWIGPVEFHD